MRAHFDSDNIGGGLDASLASVTTRPRWRTLFISDLHLGSNGCQAEALLAFLKVNSSEQLYLVGDMVDGWQLRKRWYWPEAHNRVIQKLLRMARKGCCITYVPGNHDEFARAFSGHHFGGIAVCNEAIHTTLKGQQMWVMHGDQFDGVIQCARWLAYLGDSLYDFTLWLNRHYNRWRLKMGQPYWSLSAYLKFKVKKAVMYVGDFERAVAREARRRGFDGVVCGHIHHPEIRSVEGILYCNDGDWVESHSAVAEDHAGNLILVQSSCATPQSATCASHEYQITVASDGR